MNLNFGINPPQSKEAESLYKLAYQCAHYKTTIGCSKCGTCAYNVQRYGYDPNQARLIQARARLEYAETVTGCRAAQKAEKKVSFLFTLSIILLLLFLFVGMTFVAHAQPVPPSAYRPKTIAEANAWVRQNLRDVNYDGLFNCIDYAVMFYEIWPDAKLIRCRNPEYGFNHLLNQVGDKYIEPQVSNGDPMRMWAKQWPDATKIDETYAWSFYALKKNW